MVISQCIVLSTNVPLGRACWVGKGERNSWLSNEVLPRAKKALELKLSVVQVVRKCMSPVQW